MGKRSDFPRRPHDDYDTPPEPVAFLLPHLNGAKQFAEPMAGRGHLIAALESAGLECVYATELRTGLNPPDSRIAEGVDALAVGRHAYQAAGAKVIISNPPWTRELMHPLIWHLCGIMPTWLLFDADWVHTKQAGALIRHCSTIVSVGRIRWMPGSKSTGKDNAAWHLFDRHHVDGPTLIGQPQITRRKVTPAGRDGEIVDRDAVLIGELYSRARSSIVESVRCLIECGKRLIDKKASMPHGAWLKWLADNAGVLGFQTDQTARQLMKAAQSNPKPALDLKPDEALQISRQIWGHDHVRGTFGTGENEWFTPAEYLDRARQLLGGFDLDPASNSAANEVVGAAEYFSKESDGLSAKWHGRVWLNPPYAQPAIQQFADKMVGEWQAGRVEAAVMLTHNYTDTTWFQALAHAAQAICFTRGRIRFVSPSGDLAAPTQGQAFFYFGRSVDEFVDAFADVGFVVEVRPS